MFTRDEIAAGLAMAKEVYEGWKLSDLTAEQLIECVQISEINKNINRAKEEGNGTCC